jgi:hypothetical protein
MIYPDSNLPMSQFQVFRGMGFIVITVVDMSSYDAFYGFRRVVKQIEQPL